jgi:hypothetical protein
VQRPRRRRRHRTGDAQAVLETALVIPIMLLLVCNFVGLMLQVTVQEQLDSATALAAEARFQAPNGAFDAQGAQCCPDPRCCATATDGTSLVTAGIPTGCRYAAETFYGTMQVYTRLLRWQSAPLCLTGGDSARGDTVAGGAVPYPQSPAASHVSCVVGAVSPAGVAYPGYLDRALNPPAGLYVVTCDASAVLDFSQTPLAWGVFWRPTLHAHAQALPPPFRQ